MMPVPDVAHRIIKKVQNEPLLDQHFLALFASTPRTKGDSLMLCWSQSTASHTSGGT